MYPPSNAKYPHAAKPLKSIFNQKISQTKKLNKLRGILGRLTRGAINCKNSLTSGKITSNIDDTNELNRSKKVTNVFSEKLEKN